MTCRPCIGIVGGMGPHAGIELARLCTTLADVTRDQDHPDLLLVSRPASLPDRTEYLAGRSDSNPAAGILAVVQELAAAGATAIGIACNTSHAAPILDPVRAGLAARWPAVRFCSLVEAGAQGAVAAARGAPVGLLATEGTYLSRLYDDAVEQAGGQVLRPPLAVRQTLHQAIYDPRWGLKACSSPPAAQAVDVVAEAARELARCGAGAVLLGCTELPLALPPATPAPVPLVDPMHELAAALLASAGIRVRGSPSPGARQ